MHINISSHIERVSLRTSTGDLFQDILVIMPWVGNWEAIEACISPRITYGGEAWEMNQNNYKPANQLMDRILKRILKLPNSTPREALYMETGLLDPETKIKKNRLSMEARILQGENQLMKQIIKLETKGCWAEQNKKLKTQIGITDEDLMNPKYTLKKTLTRQMHKWF